MNKNLLLIIVMLMLICISVFSVEKGYVVRVVDGDTIVVSINGKKEKVRLVGVDTPESVHPYKKVEYFAKEASRFTKKHLLNKNIILEFDSQSANRDRYDRLLRYVFIEGVNFNALLIEQGYGHAYTKYPFDYMEAFRKLEREARLKGKGLWNDN